MHEQIRKSTRKSTVRVTHDQGAALIALHPREQEGRLNFKFTPVGGIARSSSVHYS